MNSSAWIKSIASRLTTPKGRDYSYLSLFFLIFSVFIFAAIRPSVKTALTLKKEAVDLARINAEYEADIVKIIAIQQAIETIREDIPLLSQAIPERPQVNKLIDDIETRGAEAGITLTQVTVGEVNLIQKGSNQVKTLTVAMDAEGDFPDVLKFLADLSKQRRIKLTNDIAIGRSTEGASVSATLRVTMKVDGYHL